MLTYDSLAALWEDLADALSGRTSPVFDPPLRSTGHFVPTVTTVGGMVRVTCGRPGRSEVLEAPKPDNTLAAFSAFVHDPRSRRAVVCSMEPGGETSTTAYMLALEEANGVRVRLLQTCWPGLRPHLFGWGTGDPRIEVSASIRCMAWWDNNIALISNGGVPIHYDSFAGSAPAAVDFGMAFDFREWNSANGFPQQGGTWPQDPDAWEDFASCPQFPGRGDVLGAEEIEALHNLADKLALAASERGGQMANARGDTLLKVTGRPVTLPIRAPTQESAMRRIAEAVRGYAGADAVLRVPSKARNRTRGSACQVAMQSALLVLDEE